MKKSALAAFIILLTFAASAAGIWKPAGSQQPVAAQVQLISSDITTSVVQFTVRGFYLHEVKTPRGTAYTISVENGTAWLEKASPDLPKLTTSLIIPDKAMMDIEVVSSDFIEFQNLEIAPSKGNLLRTVDPSTVPYEYGRSYSENTFYPAEISNIRDPFIVRDYRGQTVIASPFQYNPISKVLRVYTTITVKLSQVNQQGFNILERDAQPRAIDADFNTIYSNLFLNTANTDYTPLADQGKMLIISHPNYIQAMQPFVDWKNRMGIRTEMIDVTTIGSTAASIKTFVEDYYLTNGLTFLLLIGDSPQIPTNTTGNLGGPSDNAYGYLVGDDHYPDIFTGRFSAENVEHVTTMVQRTLEYEMQPSTTTNWFDKGVGIGSDQGPGDDGEMDYEHMRNIRTDLIGYTYESVAELYDGSQGGEDLPGNPTPANVTTELNDGRSLINYVGHGSDNSWGTTGFSNTNVNQLANNHKWPFIFSVACVNGNFTAGTCFAEAWLRAKNANGPTGAVATLMSTINQSWDPPMDGQDEMDDILVESYPDNIKRTFGGIAMNGCMKMNETYGSGGDEMTDTWTIFGDPSVMVRTALPEPISATHDNQIFLGATTFTVNSSVEGALVALSRDNQFITSAYVNGGVATLTFPAFQMPDSVELVITAYNFIPYQTSIAVLPNDGPYLIYNHTSINDAPFNNNGQADFGETVGLNVAFANIGVMTAENVTITVTSADDYISVTDSLETYSALPAQDTTGVLDGFSMSIAENVPDNHIAVLHFTATDGNDTWSGNFSITLHTGIMHYLSYTIDDTQYGNGNHKAEPGETFDMLVTVKNTGSAPVTGIGGQISFNDQYVSNQSSPWQNFGDIEALSISEKPYTLYADPSTPEGHVITVIIHIDGDLGLQTTESFNLVIGQIPVAVIDLDGNKNSGTEIRNALNANSVYAEYKTSMPGDISGYTALFVCLGVDNKRHVLSTAEGQKLANFVDAGGRLYMEGGDTWYRDPKTAVHPKFKTNGVMDGSSDLNSESGQTGQFAEGLEFTYDGDNVFIDHISANAPAFNLFKNTTPLYITSVGYDAGTYRTIASSFEFGGLADGQFPSTKDEYMRRIIEFFGILASPYTANFMGNPINICEGESVSFVDYSTTGTTTWQWMFPGGNPASSTEQNPVINYPVTGLYDVTLITGNGMLTDTLVKKNYVWAANCTGLNNRGENTLSLYPNPASNYVTINFPVKNEIANLQIFDNQGKQILTRNSIKTDTPLVLNISALTDGIYQVKIENGNRIQTLKLAIKH